MSSSTITDSFPNDTLTLLPTDRNPSAKDIRLLRKEILANALSIPSQRGGGQLGHAAVCMLLGDYNALPAATAAWVDPVHPGVAPLIPAQATAAQISEINRQFKSDTDEFTTYKATEAALHKCVLAAVPNCCMAILEDELFGYANVSPRDILTHLIVTHSVVTQDDLTDNTNTMKTDWDPATPLETLWTQLRKAQLFAANHDAISDNTLMRTALELLEKSGVFTDTLKDWRKRAPVTQTLANLKLDFTTADRERLRPLTSRTAGYANAAVSLGKSKPPPVFANSQKEKPGSHRLLLLLDPRTRHQQRPHQSDLSHPCPELVS